MKISIFIILLVFSGVVTASDTDFLLTYPTVFVQNQAQVCLYLFKQPPQPVVRLALKSEKHSVAVDFTYLNQSYPASRCSLFSIKNLSFKEAFFQVDNVSQTPRFELNQEKCRFLMELVKEKYHPGEELKIILSYFTNFMMPCQTTIGRIVLVEPNGLAEELSPNGRVVSGLESISHFLQPPMAKGWYTIELENEQHLYLNTFYVDDSDEKLIIDIQPPPSITHSDPSITWQICVSSRGGLPIEGTADVITAMDYYLNENEDNNITYTDDYNTNFKTIEFKGCFKYQVNIHELSYYIKTSFLTHQINMTVIVEELKTENTAQKSELFEVKDVSIKIKFEDTNPVSFKPEIPYVGAVRVSNANGEAIASETIQICYQPRSKVWKEADSFCSMFNTSDDGRIYYTIPPNPRSIQQIFVNATLYDSTYDEEDELYKLPEAKTILYPWHSITNNSIQIIPNPKIHACQEEIEINFTLQTDLQSLPKLFYQLRSNDRVTKSEQVRLKDAPSLNYTNIIHHEDNINTQNSFRLHQFVVTARPMHTPLFQLILFYIHPNKEIITDSAFFKVECFRNKVSLSVDPNERLPAIMTIKARRSSKCILVGSNKNNLPSPYELLLHYQKHQLSALVPGFALDRCQPGSNSQPSNFSKDYEFRSDRSSFQDLDMIAYTNVSNERNISPCHSSYKKSLNPSSTNFGFSKEVSSKFLMPEIDRDSLLMWDMYTFNNKERLEIPILPKSEKKTYWLLTCSHLDFGTGVAKLSLDWNRVVKYKLVYPSHAAANQSFNIDIYLQLILNNTCMSIEPTLHAFKIVRKARHGLPLGWAVARKPECVCGDKPKLFPFKLTPPVSRDLSLQLTTKYDTSQTCSHQYDPNDVDILQHVTYPPINIKIRSERLPYVAYNKYFCTLDNQKKAEKDILEIDIEGRDSNIVFSPFALIKAYLSDGIEHGSTIVHLKNMATYSAILKIFSSELYEKEDEDEEILDKNLQYSMTELIRNTAQGGVEAVLGSKPSVYITSLALTLMREARAYYEGPNITTNIEPWKNYLISQAEFSGCFKAGKMEPLPKSEKLLTAFVTLSLLESGEAMEKTIIAKALNCIHVSMKNEYLLLALKAYINAAYGCNKTSQELIENLEETRLDFPSGSFWPSETLPETLMTSIYYLLTLSKLKPESFWAKSLPHLKFIYKYLDAYGTLYDHETSIPFYRLLQYMYKEKPPKNYLFIYSTDHVEFEAHEEGALLEVFKEEIPDYAKYIYNSCNNFVQMHYPIDPEKLKTSHLFHVQFKENIIKVCAVNPSIKQPIITIPHPSGYVVDEDHLNSLISNKQLLNYYSTSFYTTTISFRENIAVKDRCANLHYIKQGTTALHPKYYAYMKDAKEYDSNFHYFMYEEDLSNNLRSALKLGGSLDGILDKHSYSIVLNDSLINKIPNHPKNLPKDLKNTLPVNFPDIMLGDAPSKIPNKISKCLPQSEVSCPQCMLDISQLNASYCRSKFAILVSVGLERSPNDNHAQKDFEVWYPPKRGHISIHKMYQGIQIKVDRPIEEKYPKELYNRCLIERVRSYYDLSPGQNPQTFFKDLDLIYNVTCSCPVLHSGSGYAIILSYNELSMNANESGHVPLTKDFLIIPLEMGTTILPVCSRGTRNQQISDLETNLPEIPIPPVGPDNAVRNAKDDLFYCTEQPFDSCPKCANEFDSSLFEVYCKAQYAAIVYKAGIDDGTPLPYPQKPWYVPRLQLIGKFKSETNKVQLKINLSPRKTYRDQLAHKIFKRSVTDSSPCLQPLAIGPCTGVFQRYYYNSATKDCESFLYSGCQGTTNNFASLLECERMCTRPLKCYSSTFKVLEDVTVNKKSTANTDLHFFIQDHCRCPSIDHPVGYTLLISSKAMADADAIQHTQLTNDIILVDLPIGQTFINQTCDAFQQPPDSDGGISGRSLYQPPFRGIQFESDECPIFSDSCPYCTETLDHTAFYNLCLKKSVVQYLILSPPIYTKSGTCGKLGVVRNFYNNNLQGQIRTASFSLREECDCEAIRKPKSASQMLLIIGDNLNSQANHQRISLNEDYTIIQYQRDLDREIMGIERYCVNTIDFPDEDEKVLPTPPTAYGNRGFNVEVRAQSFNRHPNPLRNSVPNYNFQTRQPYYNFDAKTESYYPTTTYIQTEKIFTPIRAIFKNPFHTVAPPINLTPETSYHEERRVPDKFIEVTTESQGYERRSYFNPQRQRPLTPEPFDFKPSPYTQAANFYEFEPEVICPIVGSSCPYCLENHDPKILENICEYEYVMEVEVNSDISTIGAYRDVKKGGKCGRFKLTKMFMGEGEEFEEDIVYSFQSYCACKNLYSGQKLLIASTQDAWNKYKATNFNQLKLSIDQKLWSSTDYSIQQLEYALNQCRQTITEPVRINTCPPPTQYCPKCHFFVNENFYSKLCDADIVARVAVTQKSLMEEYPENCKEFSVLEVYKGEQNQIPQTIQLSVDRSECACEVLDNGQPLLLVSNKNAWMRYGGEYIQIADNYFYIISFRANMNIPTQLYQCNLRKEVPGYQRPIQPKPLQPDINYDFYGNPSREYEECPIDISCPKCSNSKISKNSYCESEFALIVSFGLGADASGSSMSLSMWNQPSVPALEISADIGGQSLNIQMSSSEQKGFYAEPVQPTNQCIKDSVKSVYEVTPRKGAFKNISDFNYYIPSHCKCPALERETGSGFGLFISNIRRDSSDKNLYMSKDTEFYPLPLGELKLQACRQFGEDYIFPRGQNLPEKIKLDSLEELESISELLIKTVECPKDMPKGCPVCDMVFDQMTFCKAREALIILGNLTQANVPPQMTVVQSTLEDDFSIKINLEAPKMKVEHVVQSEEFKSSSTQTSEKSECWEPVKKGPCSNIVLRYFFNSTTSTCEPFQYGGCLANRNNFETMEKCVSTCSAREFCKQGSFEIKSDITKSIHTSELTRSSSTYLVREYCECQYLSYPTSYALLLSMSQDKSEDGPIMLSGDHSIVPDIKELGSIRKCDSS